MLRCRRAARVLRQESSPPKDTMGQTVDEESMDVKKESQEQPPHSDTASMQNDNFNWDTYLKETASIRAPSEYFRQSAVPPVNEFKVGMKLEARDPRNTASVCVASVIATTGARLRLRLDGSGSQNDFWRLVDSSDIQPVGTCEKSGELLKPPLGFQMNISFWPIFLCRTLTGSEPAPPEFFKKEPPKPPINNFKVGMKIEAVDRKNPQMICPATIGAVQGDQIYITMDGWSRAFHYWCRYDSRDIFPVGWCFLTGDLFCPPGNIALSAKNIGKTETSTSKVKLSQKTLPSVKPSQKMALVLPTLQAKKSGHTESTGATSDLDKDSSLTNITTKEGIAKPRKKHEQSIPVVPSTSSAPLSSLMIIHKDSIEEPSETVMSTGNERETARKKSIKRSQHPETYLAPVSVKKPKMTVHASKEEVLSPEGEGHGVPKEETFPEDSKNLSVGDFSVGEVISPSILEMVPSTISLDLFEKMSPTQSSCEDTEFKLELTPDEEVLSPEGEGHGVPKEETFPEDSKNLSVGDFSVGEVISPSILEMVPSTFSLDLFEKMSPTQSSYEDTEFKLELTPDEEVLSPEGEGHGVPKEKTFCEDSKNLSVGDFSVGEVISPSIPEMVPSTFSLDLPEKMSPTQSSYEDTEFKLELTPDEEVLFPEGEGHGMPKEETFPEDSTNLSVGDFSVGEVISPSILEMVSSTLSLDLLEKNLSAQSCYDDSEFKLELITDEEVLSPEGEGHGVPKEKTFCEDSKNLSVGDFSVGDFSVGEVISPSIPEMVPSTLSLDLPEKISSTQSSYEDTEFKLELTPDEEVLFPEGEGHGMPKEETFPEDSKNLSVGDFSVGEVISPSILEMVSSTLSLDLLEKNLSAQSCYEDSEFKLELTPDEEVLSPEGEGHGVPKEETFPEDSKNLSVGDFSVGEVISLSIPEMVPSTLSLDLPEKMSPTQSSYEDTEFKLELTPDEEVLSPEGEGHGVPKEETFPEDSKNLSVGDFSVGEVISPSIPEMVPSTFSLDLPEKMSPTQSSYEDTEFKLDKNNEGN